ncbi:MAG: S8 family serine peptidase [Nocardioidaceae bacterium]
MAATALAAGSANLPTAHAGTAEDVTCDSVTQDVPRQTAQAASRPLSLLAVGRAQQLVDAAAGGRRPVRVAVVDSGIADSPLLDVVERVSFTSAPAVLSYHGTAVAGLVAGSPRPDGGLVGVAPRAQLVDVRVYDEKTPTDAGSVGVSAPLVARGLRWVAVHAEDLGIGVVNVSLLVPRDDELEAAVRAVQRHDVVVVASSGNRPQDESDPLFDEFAVRAGDEDAAGFVFPAGYPGVVAVNATSGDPLVDDRDAVLQNSATVVAAPTPGAVSVALNGGTCVLPDVATSWSAAEVSGVVALLRTRFPRETAAQVVARLRATASATPGSASPLEGAGIVQPVEALTRPLEPSRAGELVRNEPAPPDTGAARAPSRPRDLVPELRRTALWWGLGGGAAAVLALLLRPLLVRRRARP